MDRANLEYYYETNVIDTSCFEGDVLIETVRAIYSGDGATIAVVILILLLIVVICGVIGYCMCKKDKCCLCFLDKCSCCIPKAYRKNITTTSAQSTDPKENDDFDDISKGSIKEKTKGLKINIDDAYKEQQKSPSQAKYTSMQSIKMSP